MAGDTKKVIYAALIGNSLIAVTKFVASAVTGSSAMLSEGIHSLVDTGYQVLLLHGLRRSKQPPEPRFPFGFGQFGAPSLQLGTIADTHRFRPIVS